MRQREREREREIGEERKKERKKIVSKLRKCTSRWKHIENISNLNI